MIVPFCLFEVSAQREKNNLRSGAHTRLLSFLIMRVSFYQPLLNFMIILTVNNIDADQTARFAQSEQHLCCLSSINTDFLVTHVI